MKVTVTLKDPDVLSDAVEDAVKAEVEKIPGLSQDEKEMFVEHRCEKVMEIMDKWWEYSEYLTVTFDTEAMTAKVDERA